MKKDDLRTGDIVLQRGGFVGMYIEKRDEGYIVYQNEGYDEVDFAFDDDLYNAYNESEFDIMQVFRDDDGVLGFLDYAEGEMIFERKAAWTKPSDEEMADREKGRLEKVNAFQKVRKEMAEKNRKNKLYIIAQGFYGNRTGTIIDRSEVKVFLRGNPGQDVYFHVNQVEICMVHVPNSENVVIVYDLNQEREYLDVKFPKQYKERGTEYLRRYKKRMKPYITCEIPEIDVKIHTRCFACRLDENGDFQSLGEGDAEKFIDYFPIR